MHNYTIIHYSVELQNKIEDKFYIICESLNLRTFISPGVFIAIANNNGKPKKRFDELKQNADFIVYNYDLESFNLNQINCLDKSWNKVT